MTLQAHDLTFSYSSDQSLLEELTLSLPAGRKVALTGPNGSGKSTLLRLLAGDLAPDRGRTQRSGGELSFVGQQVEHLHPNRSGGEARIAALRAAFGDSRSTLLLDEPTNDLDADAREWLRAQILASSATLLIVSHDPMILDSVDEIWELRQGKIQRHPPGYEAYLERLDAEERRLRDEIDTLRAESREVERTARKVAESQQKRMSRGAKQSIKSNEPRIARGLKKRRAEQTLARVTGVQEKRIEIAHERMRAAQTRLRTLSMFEWDSSTTRPPAGKTLLSIREARLPGATEAVSFEVRGAERAWIRGRNGSGKSTLLRALAGDPAARERAPGQYSVTVPFQLFDQALSQFDSAEPLWQWFHERSRLEVPLARAILGRLGFEQEEQQRPVRGLSGGERVRLEIALALHSASSPQLLLLDEPTNHLDLESRRILLQFIERFEGALVVVSHDAAFTRAIAFDRMLELGG